MSEVRRALRSIGDSIRKRYGSRNSRDVSRKSDYEDLSKEEGEGPTVMLNNRPVRMDRNYFKKPRKRMQTETSADVGTIKGNASRVLTEDV